MASTPGSAAPVTATERIASIDVLRGFAVLGILVMNIQSFSMIEAAYFNPAASRFFEGSDWWIWTASHLFTDQKFMTLFSMLFGAGIVLMAERVDSKGGNPLALHYRRTFWLLVIGIAHAYLLWFGDVLVWYALCSFVVYPLRKVRPSRLLALGLSGIVIGSLLNAFFGLSLPKMPPEDVATFFESSWQPDDAHVAEEIQAFRSGYTTHLTARIPTAFGMHTVAFLAFAFWRAAGNMLIGMALFKWGVFAAQKSATFYRRLAISGIGLGLPIVLWGVIRNTEEGWSLEFSRFFGAQYNHWGSMMVAAGYIGVIMLWAQGNLLTGLRTRLAAVGRMALTNYLAQTLICTFLFYGHGLGWFMKADRTQQMLVVVAVWTLQLLWSPVWLARFQFGPFEWLWRSLTYWRLQPFRKV